MIEGWDERIEGMKTVMRETHQKMLVFLDEVDGNLSNAQQYRLGEDLQETVRDLAWVCRCMDSLTND